ncbi:uncharacterized protein LOC108839983 isoform X2 [Raphanus sativus]|uniref:Uncharacterized protein LOC108839983 isoform X2 n=1 Tax=Raphanus sativus TaxID=3726 RepID=A0A9W3D971_RAPSA|nr:uncharacterized protein LOC108839983 isoform X2 [Raphanus sativus]
MDKTFQRSALLVTFFFFIPVSISVPFIHLHGVNDQCSSAEARSFTQLLRNLSSSPGYCLEIGNGEHDSMYMPLMQQASIACEKVKQMKELSQGYNIVAQSQGNMVARGLIEFCDDAPPVFNYVSLGGPHAGISIVPPCPVGASYPLCQLHETEVYTDSAQEIPEYMEHCKFLPKLNNERPNERNSTYKERFTSLHNLVLVMFEGDTIVVPKETCWFGFYPDGATAPLLPPQQTKLYTEDWIGLKTLDDAGKVKFVGVHGDHLEMAHDDVVRYVVPYLQNQLAFSS